INRPVCSHDLYHPFWCGVLLQKLARYEGFKMTKEFNAEIVAVGTEILLGQIAKTNAKWLSEQLASRGINVHFHEVVGDNRTRVAETFRKAHQRSDIIIVTGGLGPTEDDLTREAFQSLSGLDMTEHKP